MTAPDDPITLFDEEESWGNPGELAKATAYYTV
jgi:hypothetical protein